MKTRLFLLITLAAVSCTVFDNRNECPGFVTVDASAYTDTLTDWVKVGLHDGSGYAVNVIERLDSNNQFSYRVPRHKYLCSVSCGYDTAYVKNDILATPWDCRDSVTLARSVILYGATEKVVLDSVERTVTLPVHKQYMNMTVYVKDGVAKEHFDSIKVVFTSSTAGISLRTLEGVRGSFMYTTRLKGINIGKKLFSSYVTLPRQAYGDLKLSFLMYGDVIKSYNITQLLDQFGYDWNKEDLDNVEIYVSLNSSSIEMYIGSWLAGGVIDEKL